MTQLQLRNPVIVALDIDSPARILELARHLNSRVGAFKIGPRAVLREGSNLIKELAQIGPVFLDLKFLDIPSTMEAAVKAAFDAGATLVTVHTWAGFEALKKLAELQRQLRKIRPFMILGVTVLTSFDEKTLPPGLESKSLLSHVQGLCEMSLKAGLDGFVCSPHEAAALRVMSPHSFLVTPGIRWTQETVLHAPDDQARVMTPEKALSEGASALVVGRPLIEAASPAEAVNQLLVQIGYAPIGEKS